MMATDRRCWCKRFDVPWCCGRYLEDAEGKIVHTPDVCYRVGDDGLPVVLEEVKP